MALKWYTRARKFPQLIGRTPDGTRIPGGPYTYTQVAAGVGTAIVMAQTTWLWAHGSLLLNATIYIGAVIGAVIATGKLPPGMRNPLVLATGALNLLNSGYRIGGAALPHPKPTTATTPGPITVFEASQTGPDDTQPAGDDGQSDGVEVLELQPRQVPELTGVQRLLLGKPS